MSKNISLKKDAYDALKSLQLEGESFSDTILRIRSKFMNLKNLLGTGTLDDNEYEAELIKLQEQRRKWR